MPFGFQFLPGAPTDPNQPEQPSIPELLGVLAGNIYGGDPRYSAGAGIGNAAADIFGGMRGKRQEVRALGQLKSLYPDLQLDKLAAAGIKPTFGEIAQLVQQKQQQEQQQKLLEQLSSQFGGAQQPGKPGARPQLSLPQLIGLRQAGIPAPFSWTDAPTPKSPWQAELEQYGGDIAKALTADTQRQQQIAGGKAASVEQAKKDIGGETKYFERGATGILAKWGYDPAKVPLGDPVLSDAGEAIGMEKARQKISQSERNAYRTAKESMFNIGRLKDHLAMMQKKRLPIDSQTMYQEWLAYHATQSKDPTMKGLGAYGTGDPRKDYANLFSLIGQVRNRLAPVYMPPGMRSQKFLEQSQEHLPVEGANGGQVMESIKMLEPLVKVAMDDLAPQQDPRRQRAIKQLMYIEDGTTPRIDTATGKPVTASRAAFITDKLLGLSPDVDPMSREPATSTMPAAE